jgi:hypothetical protein
MKIRPLLNFHLLGCDSRHTLDSAKWYDATPATNQPEWQEKGKVFVSFDHPDIDPENAILLESGDYVTAV